MSASRGKRPPVRNRVGSRGNSASSLASATAQSHVCASDFHQ